MKRSSRIQLSKKYIEMNKSIIILLVVFSFSISAASAQEGTKLSGTVNVEVNGLSCPFCAYGLEKNLKSIPNIEKISIDVEEAFVTLIIKEGQFVFEKDIKKKVKDAGFTAGDIKEITNE